MSKVTIIASTKDLKEELIKEVLKLKNKGCLLLLAKEDENFLKDSKTYNNFVELSDFVKNNDIDCLTITYLSSLRGKLKDFFNFINICREKNINVCIVTHIHKDFTDEPKTWHLPYISIIANEIIFLYTKNDKIVRKILNKEQIQEERKQAPALDRGLGRRIGKFLKKYLAD